MRRLVPACLVSLACACSAHAAVPPGFVGLYSDDGFYGDAGYRLSEMETQARLGVGTVRQPFEWWRVETRPGRFDFTPYDGYVADAARAGLSVLPVLIAPPAFRSSRPPGSRSRAMFPPRRFGDFARFAAAAVRRYGPGGGFWTAHSELPYVPIHAWQVWNE